MSHGALGRDSNAYQAYTRVSREQALNMSHAIGGSGMPDPSLEAAFPGYVQAPP